MSLPRNPPGLAEWSRVKAEANACPRSQALGQAIIDAVADWLTPELTGNRQLALRKLAQVRAAGVAFANHLADHAEKKCTGHMKPASWARRFLSVSQRDPDVATKIEDVLTAVVGWRASELRTLPSENKPDSVDWDAATAQWLVALRSVLDELRAMFKGEWR